MPVRVPAWRSRWRSPWRQPWYWRPENLFADGSEGFWYEPADQATVFADAADTVPAAVDGLVWRFLDKSGNGHHFTQATAAQQPVLRAADTRRWLKLDGADDKMFADVLSGFSAALTVVVGVAFDDASLAVRHTVLSSSSVDARSGWYLYLNNTFPQIITRGGYSSSTTAWLTQPQLPAPDTAPHVVATRYRPGQQNSRIDAQYSHSATGVAHDESASTLTLGANPAGDLPGNIRFSGALGVARYVSDQEQLEMVRYVARLTGVAL